MLAMLYVAAMTRSSALADVRLPVFFSDHMVLQRDVPVPIWGWAAPGESVALRLDGQSRTTTADDRGQWSVRFDPLPATASGAAPLTLEIDGRSRLVLEDVLVGEVWLCSGQSNMEFTVSEALDSAREIAAAREPRVRQFLVPRAGAPEPRDASFLGPASWVPATPRSVGNFTAVGYFFAREVSRALGGMPVGLINSSWGGTAIQSWMSRESLEAVPGRYEALLKAKEGELAAWPARLRAFEAATHEWEQRAAAARDAGQPEPPFKPWNPGPPDLPQWTPANLYNGMIHPLEPYAMRGVLWYQGEANAGWGAAGAREYASLLSEMIRRWRAGWNEGDFPFYFVQLPNWHSLDDPSGVSWAFFRDGQRSVLDVPETGMAVTIDVGESEDIHPHNKQAVGERLARIALQRTCGQPIVDQGPIYRAMRPEGPHAVRLEFDHAGNGLVSKDGPPRHFELAGEERKFYPAEAVVEGREVVVTCPQVPLPVAVRYAWSNDPAGCNLYNGENLPAMPFRTDDW